MQCSSYPNTDVAIRGECHSLWSGKVLAQLGFVGNQSTDFDFLYCQKLCCLILDISAKTEAPTIHTRIRFTYILLSVCQVGVIGNLVHSSPNIKKDVLVAGALQPVIGLVRCVRVGLIHPRCIFSFWIISIQIYIYRCMYSRHAQINVSTFFFIVEILYLLAVPVVQRAKGRPLCYLVSLLLLIQIARLVHTHGI